MRIRELRRKDTKGLTEFFRRLSPEIFVFWNRLGFSVRELMRNNMAEIICALEPRKERGFICLDNNKKVIGYSHLRFFPEKKTKRQSASLGIVVLEEFQNRGIGTKMMRYMHSWAKQKGITKIWLHVYTKNKKAIRLYKKLGYQIEGVFMYDELSRFGWDHTVSMALFLDRKFKDALPERCRLIEAIRDGRALQ
jgi:RimJ/RimL family protein N-acetyltransferase